MKLGGGYPATFEEAYSCTRDCQLGEGWNVERRAGRGCTRPDLPPVRWRLSIAELYQRPASGAISCGLYRGRDYVPSMQGQLELGAINVVGTDAAGRVIEEPIEPAADGCPGGWYRTPYVNSLARYVRRRTEDGGRVPNPFFDRADWQTQEAALLYEEEQERWHSYRAKTDRARWEAAEQARAAKQKGGKRGSRR